MYYLGLKMFEATNILLAETRHMHQEMTFVLPLWTYISQCFCKKSSKCGFPKQILIKKGMVPLRRIEATSILLAERQNMYKWHFSFLCKDNNATVKKVLSVGFPKQILVKKMWHGMYYLGLKMFEATNILLAETRHIHQEMTFVLPLWTYITMFLVLQKVF